MALMTLQGLLGSTDGLVQGFLGQHYPAVAQLVSIPVYLAAVIYWVVYGLKVYGGHLGIDGRELLTKCVATALVFAMLHWGGMASRFYAVFTSSTESLAATVMAGQSTATMIDSLYDNVESIANTLKSVKLYQIAMILDGFLLFILNCLLFIVAAGYMMIAKYGMGITFLLAPIFTCFALFDATRHWFSAWLGKMLTFVWLYVLVVAIVRLGFFAFKDAINEAGQLASSGVHPALLNSNLTGQLFIVMAVMILFMLGVRGWAAALGGGAAGGTGALVMIARGVVGSLKGRKQR